MRNWLTWGLALLGGGLLVSRMMRGRGGAYQWMLRAVGPQVAKRMMGK